MLSAIEEGQIVKEILDNHKLKDGKNYYVLNGKWFTIWKTYVGYDLESSIQELNYGQRPDVIDNAILLEDVNQLETTEESKASIKSTKLRKNLHKGIDFEIVPEDVWLHLHKWYGGGPPILRTAISVGILLNQVQVELWPIPISIECTGQHTCQDPDHIFMFSARATMKEVIRKVARHFNSPPHKCTLHFPEESNPLELTKVPTH